MEFRLPRLQLTRYSQYDFTIERQLPSDITLRVPFVGSRAIRLWDIWEGNRAIATSIAISELLYLCRVVG
jgi:hypothetical protein